MKLFNAALAFMLTANASASITTFISVDAVTLYANPGHAQNIQLLNTLGNTYDANHPWQNDSTVMPGIGLRAYKGHDFSLNTSLRLMPLINMQGSGDVLQLYSPRFRNLAYTYDMTSNVLLADNIVTWTAHRLQPGFIIGLGGASNTTSNYLETPLSNHAAPSLDHFRGNTQTQFAYELGAVLDYPMNDIVFELAYRYLDTGQGQLGLSPLQNTTQHLTTGPLRYHVLSLGVRFDHTI